MQQFAGFLRRHFFPPFLQSRARVSRKRGDAEESTQAKLKIAPLSLFCYSPTQIQSEHWSRESVWDAVQVNVTLKTDV